MKPIFLQSVFALSLAISVSACGSGEPVSEPAASTAPAEPDTEASAPTGQERTILAYGDSLFAGYRLEQSESYPAQLQAALRDGGMNATVVNAGVSGDTTAAGRQRFVFTLDSQQTKPDLLILELGGNDLLRGLPVEQTRANLEAMLAEAQSRDIPVLLMGMRAPPNYGGEYQRQFDAIYPDLAREYGADLVPFFPEAVVGQADLIQADRIHPTAQGVVALVADTLDEVQGALPES